MSNFYPFEVVGRSSETQLQVVAHLNYLIYRFMGKITVYIMVYQRCCYGKITDDKTRPEKDDKSGCMVARG